MQSSSTITREARFRFGANYTAAAAFQVHHLVAIVERRPVHLSNDAAAAEPGRAAIFCLRIVAHGDGFAAEFTDPSPGTKFPPCGEDLTDTHFFC